MNCRFLAVAGLICTLNSSLNTFAQDPPTVPPGVVQIDPTAVALDQKSLANDRKTPALGMHKEQLVLHFVAKEIEGGHVINTRDYSARTYADSNPFGDAQIRTGGRVPVSVSGNTTQFTYIDVGIDFDCRYIQLVGDQLNMQVGADISSYKEASSGAQPIIQQNKWVGSVAIMIGKTATIFSFDDVVSKRTLQIGVTVNRV